MQMIRAGISTACFYPETTERSLEYAAASGADCLEIFVNADQEFSYVRFRDFERIARENGTRIVSVHPYTSAFEPLIFFSAYQRRFEDGLKQYGHLFELTAAVGAQYFIFHGAGIRAAVEDECIFERTAKLARLAHSCGITLLQENVARCKSRSPEFIRAMRACLGEDAAFVLDTKQAVRSEVSVEEMRAAMGDRLRHIHISDCDETRDCLPPGQGNADLRGLISRLRANNFNGDLILELYKDGYSGLAELYESYDYLNELLVN